MTSALYHLDSSFEALEATLLAGVDPRRLRTLHILVHQRSTREDALDPVAAACEYAAFLQLASNEIAYFKRVSRADAERACTNVAEFELVMSTRQMPHTTAAASAAAWVEQFDDTAIFFVNGMDALASPPDVGDARSLFHTDLEAGVLAVSPTKAGLFWSAENS